MDYPEKAKEVAEAIQNKKAEKGVLICGTGLGMSIAANKFKGIRATVCYSEEVARYARKHNDSNVLAQDVSSYTLIAYLDSKRTTDEDNPRHVVDKEKTALILSP